MRIAVASEGLEVAPRFRQCASYMCYRVERGIIVECQNLPNPGLAAPKLVALLVEMGVDTLMWAPSTTMWRTCSATQASR